MAPTVDAGEHFLLSLTKQTKISNIRALDLSSRELERVDGELLKRIPQLEVLNISDNLLKSFPTDLHLPCLRKLDVSENEITSIAFVESLTALKELNVDGNFLDASDRFVAVTLCPTLEKLNGRDTKSYKTFVNTKTAKLEEAIKELWDEEYGPKYGQDIPERVQEELKKKAMKVNVDSNTPYVKLRTSMIERLCRELIERVQTKKYAPLTPRAKKVSVKRLDKAQPRRYTILKDKNNNRTPTKAKSTPVKSKGTPIKSLSTPIKSTPLKLTPLKVTPLKLKLTPAKVPSASATPSKSIISTPGQRAKSRKSISFKDVVEQATAGSGDDDDEDDDDDDDDEDDVSIDSDIAAEVEEEPDVKKPKHRNPSPSTSAVKKRGRPKTQDNEEENRSRRASKKSTKRQQSPSSSPENKPSTKRKRTEEKSTPKKTATPSKKLSVTTPKTATPKKTETPKKISPKKKKGRLNLTELPSVPDYEPTHFLRCHFGDKAALRKGHLPTDDPSDGLTRIWECAFEPPRGGRQNGGGLVATCGGNTVCLVDCGSGRVMKRFHQEKEHFFCLAWTTVPMEKDGKSWETNILAVGGWNGHIRLLHPEQLVCYKELGNNGRPNKAVVEYYVCALRFHPTEPTWLFSGSSDASITLFDIGKPDLPNYDNCVTKSLRVFDTPSDVLNMELFVAPLNLMLAGCEDGCYVYDLKNCDQKANKRQKSSAELLLPRQEDWAVDGLTKVTDDLVASRSREDPCIYVWKLEPLKAGQEKVKVVPILQLYWTNSLESFISLGNSGTGYLGNGDEKGRLYIYNLTQALDNHITSQNTLQTPRMLHSCRLVLNLDTVLYCIVGYLGNGDEKGRLYVYNLTQALDNHITSQNTLQPSRVLQWPQLGIDERRSKDSKMKDVPSMKEAIVNCVTISRNHQFIVTGTDQNLLCIWKRT